MEPIKININVEVGLKQATIDILKGIFAPKETAGFDVPAPAPATAPAPTPAPVAQPEAPATKVEDMDDLPPDDAPTPQKPLPTEDDARQAVKAARSRGVPAKKIKDYMRQKFNIDSSVECPAERRQELIDGLKNLAA